MRDPRVTSRSSWLDGPGPATTWQIYFFNPQRPRQNISMRMGGEWSKSLAIPRKCLCVGPHRHERCHCFESFMVQEVLALTRERARASYDVARQAFVASPVCL